MSMTEFRSLVKWAQPGCRMGVGEGVSVRVGVGGMGVKVGVVVGIRVDVAVASGDGAAVHPTENSNRHDTGRWTNFRKDIGASLDR